MDFGFIPYNYTIRNIVRDKFEMHTFGAYVIAILSATYKDDSEPPGSLKAN